MYWDFLKKECPPCARKVANWLTVVEECQIQNSTRSIANNHNSINLEDEELLFIFDVSSLYTKVPVHEAIDVCLDFLFSWKYQKPLVSKETFKKISTSYVLMLTHVGYYRQKDRLAMVSPQPLC